MKKHALYFMPDISGFTNFVHSTEIEHSRHIISELLEKIIDSNVMNLQLAEIEGDALFMYTLKTPPFGSIIEQSQKMFEEFTFQVEKYETQRICQCGACMSASNLKVKFIVHYGEITFMRVKHIVKPYGIDVIKSHLLLKNRIPSNQYILISSETASFYGVNLNKEPSFQSLQDDYGFGKVKYFYKNFAQIKIENRSSNNQFFQKPKTPPKLTFNTVLEANIVNAYSIMSDFNVRTVWYKLVDNLLYDELRVNRIGTRHCCISGSNIYKVDTLGTKGNNEQLIYGERTEDIKHLSTFSYYMNLSPINKGKTCLQTEVFYDYSINDIGVQDEIQEAMKNVWEDSLIRLSKLMVKTQKEPLSKAY